MAALGHDHPAFAHHSLLTGPQGEALSKRLGTLSLRDLRARGVEPMALLSLMARLGSSQPVELRDTPAALAEAFEPSQFRRGADEVRPADLDHLTANVLQAAPLSAVEAEVAAAGVPEGERERFWSVVRDNVGSRAEIADWWRLMSNGAAPQVAPEDADFVAAALAALPDPPWTGETWSTWTAEVKDRTGRKGRALFQPLRRLATGRDAGPDMAALMPLIRARPRV